MDSVLERDGGSLADLSPCDHALLLGRRPFSLAQQSQKCLLSHCGLATLKRCLLWLEVVPRLCYRRVRDANQKQNLVLKSSNYFFESDANYFLDLWSCEHTGSVNPAVIMLSMGSESQCSSGSVKYLVATLIFKKMKQKHHLL